MSATVLDSPSANQDNVTDRIKVHGATRQLPWEPTEEEFSLRVR